VVVGIVIGVVLVLLIGVMRWADKRDRAKGHVNRGMGDIRSTIRANRVNTRVLRSRGGAQGAVSPHEFARRNSKRR
jgi:hypothetical protein